MSHNVDLHTIGAAFAPSLLILFLLLWTLRSLRQNRAKLGATSTNESSVSSPKKKYWRIQAIPNGVSKDELCQRLRDAIPSVALEYPGKLNLTFEPSSYKYYTATILTSSSLAEIDYPCDVELSGITPLFGGVEASVDIVTVPGLGSHALGGFKAKGSDHVWLRDFLPDDLPAARVLTYGYGSKITDRDVKSSITDLAIALLDSLKAFRETTQTTRRPIILIGHSLGGLLIKEMLSRSFEGRSDTQNSDLFKSTYGLLFFGVPNLGLRYDKLKEITVGQLNSQLINDLTLDTESEPTPYLKELNRRFNECCRLANSPFQIITYYERKRTPTVEMKNGTLSRSGELSFMVTEESASRIGFEEQDRISRPLALDHSELVKFPHRSDDSYCRVLNELKRLTTEALDIVERRFSLAKRLSPAEKRHWQDLNVPDYKAFKNDLDWLARPAKGTIQWLVSPDSHFFLPGPESLRSSDFLTWRDSPKDRVLLVTGPAGQGKSVLSSFVVDHLQEHAALGGNEKVLFYFCNIKNDQAFRTGSSILRALIVQLCEDARLFQNLPNRFQDARERDNFHSARFDDLWGVFSDLCQERVYKKIYCVIDGLDVYNTDMAALLRKITEPATDERCGVRFFCTSRPETVKSVNTASPSSPHKDQHLAHGYIQQKILRIPRRDFTLFIDESLAQFPEQFTDEMKDTVKEQVAPRLGGTFLWISIVLREIRNIRYPDENEIRAKIQDIPSELGDLYRKLAEAVFREDPYDVAILAWAAYAKRPLSIEELETAATIVIANANADTATSAISSGSGSDCARAPAIRKKPLHASTVRKNLGTLVDIVSGKVYLIHESLRDYLLGSDIWHCEDVKLKLPRPELALARACVTFLSGDNSNPTLRYPLIRDDPFFSYAATFWYQHINNSEDIRDNIRDLRRILVGPNALHWIDARKHTYRDPRLTLNKTSVCEIAIYFDIAWLARLILDDISNSFSEIFQPDCLLNAAMASPKVLQELLRHARARSFSISKDVVAAAAANRRSGLEAMKLLLQERTDKVHITEEVVTAAVGNWTSGVEILKLLLQERNDEVKITENVVLAATGIGGVAVMKLLLQERGDEFKITEKVLTVAARTGSAEVLKLFLEKRGDEVKITEEVLKAAAESGNIEGMKLLLRERGNEVKITDEVVKAGVKNWRANIDVIGLLLQERGDSIGIAEALVQTADSADKKGVLEPILQAQTADVEITEEAIKAAAKRGRTDTLKMLLRDRSDKVKITEAVVRAAAENGNDNVALAQLLLHEKHKNINLAEEVIKTALGERMSGVVVMKMLLQGWGDEIHITEGVVKAAVRNWHGGMEILKLLLQERGSEVKVTEGVLKIAAKKGSVDTLKLLLKERPEEVKITQGVIKAASENWMSGVGMISMLLQERGNEVVITEDILKTAAENWSPDIEILRLLLRRRGGEGKISEEVVKRAVGNWRSGIGVINMLVGEFGDDIDITEGVIRAAAYSGQLEGIDLLCQKFGFLHLQDELVPIAMFFNAVRTGNAVMAQRLLEDGVSADTKNIKSESPLWIAASLGQKEVVELLSARDDVDINSRSVDGRSPIFWPSADGDEALVAILLRAGATTDMADKSGETPVSIARKRERYGVLRMLKQRDLPVI